FPRDREPARPLHSPPAALWAPRVDRDLRKGYAAPAGTRIAQGKWPNQARRIKALHCRTKESYRENLPS
ncbi:hypothetical protein M9458_038344, partial [Cirrhinus mrigala]